MLERLRRGGEPDDPRYASLSPQERRILDLIADGLTNRQIGAEMYLAEKTVKNYVSSLLHKLGCRAAHRGRRVRHRAAAARRTSSVARGQAGVGATPGLARTLTPRAA